MKDIKNFWNSPEVKVCRGAAGIVGGFATATGAGLVFGILNAAGMGKAAIAVGKKQAEMGAKLFDEGIKEINEKSTD